jgi:hypothetical protein
MFMRFNLVVLVCLALFIGCSKKSEFQQAAATGIVNVDGQPLEDGTIQFYPDVKVKGVLVQAKVTGGKFSFTKESGPTVGANRVSVSATKKTGNKVSNDGVESDEVIQYLPWQYNEATKLTAVIKPAPETNELKFELKSEAEPRPVDGQVAAP